MIATLVELLGVFYHNGNFPQLETVARSMLSAIPNNIVALQFLGLALYQMGRIDEAKRVFHRVAAETETAPVADGLAASEPASVTAYREATRPGSGLAEGWYRIAKVTKLLGFKKAALRAFQAALKARDPQHPSALVLHGSPR